MRDHCPANGNSPASFPSDRMNLRMMRTVLFLSSFRKQLLHGGAGAAATIWPFLFPSGRKGLAIIWNAGIPGIDRLSGPPPLRKKRTPARYTEHKSQRKKHRRPSPGRRCSNAAETAPRPERPDHPPPLHDLSFMPIPFSSTRSARCARRSSCPGRGWEIPGWEHGASAPAQVCGRYRPGPRSGSG